MIGNFSKQNLQHIFHLENTIFKCLFSFFLFSATNFFPIGFIHFVFFLRGKQNLNSEIRKNILAKPFPKDIEDDHALNLMHSTDFLILHNITQ